MEFGVEAATVDSAVDPEGLRPAFWNTSDQSMRPVNCITTKRVKIDIIVMARPAYSSKKKEYENNTR